MSQILSVVREVRILEAERDHAHLHLLHATGVERGDPAKNFKAFARNLRDVFAPAPRKTARDLFAIFKARAQKRESP